MSETHEFQFIAGMAVYTNFMFGHMAPNGHRVRVVITVSHRGYFSFRRLREFVLKLNK